MSGNLFNDPRKTKNVILYIKTFFHFYFSVMIFLSLDYVKLFERIEHSGIR